jgi:hypothetical protein
MPTNPEIDLEVPCIPKLPVPDLIRHRHPIFFVEHLVETFAAVGSDLDAVCCYRGHESGPGEEVGEGTHRYISCSGLPMTLSSQLKARCGKGRLDGS